MSRRRWTSAQLDAQANEWAFGFLTGAVEDRDADGYSDRITQEDLDEACSDAVGLWPTSDLGDADSERFANAFEHASKRILAGERAAL